MPLDICFNEFKNVIISNKLLYTHTKVMKLFSQVR